MDAISSARIPLLFVFLWSSSYIAVDFCSTHVEPATFVLVRSAITALILFFIVIFVGARWPKRWEDFNHCMVVGILIHGVYASGFFASIYLGINVVVSALILSLQPILTTLLSYTFLGEEITRKKTGGILAGFLGVSIVILEGKTHTAQLSMQYGVDVGAGNNILAISLCFVALFAISIATIIQKRHCGEIEPMPSVCIQYSAAAIFMLPFALTLETMKIDWNFDFVLGLGWLVIFVSIGAMSLLMILIKNGEAGSVANLFYLVTPLVAVEAWILFDEEITLAALGGMLLCMVGVVVVNYVQVAVPSETGDGLNEIAQEAVPNPRLNTPMERPSMNELLMNLLEGTEPTSKLTRRNMKTAKVRLRGMSNCLQVSLQKCSSHYH